MAKKKQSTKSLVPGKKKTYSYDERLEILRYWDLHDMDTQKTMSRFDIGRSTLFRWKKHLWDDAITMKDVKLKSAQQAENEKKSSSIVPVAAQKKIDRVKSKATTATEQILDLIMFKLERETEFMTDNPEKMGSVRIHELSKLLDVASSYVLPKATTSEQEGAFSTMEQKYSRITQYVQNNFLNREKEKEKENGSKKNTVAGDGRFATIIPGSRTKGQGNGDSESPVQE